MKRFMVRFQGFKNGWVGKSEIFTITVSADTHEEATKKLAESYTVEAVKYYRELKK